MNAGLLAVALAAAAHGRRTVADPVGRTMMEAYPGGALVLSADITERKVAAATSP